MTMTGYLDGMGMLESTGTVFDEDHVSGSFTITPEGSSSPNATGTSTMLRTDPSPLIAELVPGNHAAGSFITENPPGTDFSMEVNFDIPLSLPSPM